jgi:hypothetical protein
VGARTTDFADSKGCEMLGGVEQPKRLDRTRFPWFPQVSESSDIKLMIRRSLVRVQPAPRGVPAGQPGLSRFGLSGSARTSSRERLRSGRPMASSKDRLGRSRGTVCSLAS